MQWMEGVFGAPAIFWQTPTDVTAVCTSYTARRAFKMAADDGSVVLRIKRKRTEDPLDALREFLDFLNMYERSFCLILYPAQGLKKFSTHASFLNVFFTCCS